MALAVPAFAITESDVEAQVSSMGREAVTGNVLIWFLCAVAFLKVSQKIDSFMATMGVNVGRTGGSMLAEAMVAFRGVSMAAGAVGHVFGGAHHGPSSSGGGTASGTSDPGGSGWFLKGGLAGAMSRKITSDAVKTATATKTDTHAATASTAAQRTATASHTATAAQVSSTVQKGSSVHRATATQATSWTGTRSTGFTQWGAKAASAGASSPIAALRHGGIGGALFTSSLQSGGRFANDVIGKVARGDIRSTGAISGDMAAQAMMSYTGITALGDSATEKVAYSGVEMGGGHITGTEVTPEHPEGIAFGMYHVDQYAPPEGDFSKVHTADGAQWYKQYAADTVVKKPFTAPDGEVDYTKEIVKRLPNPPKRKDRM